MLKQNVSPKIDVHVHMVGNGSGNSGCWIRIHKANRLQLRLMLQHSGFSPSILTENLEERFVEKLLGFVRESSLDAVVILATEQPHNEKGEVLEDHGTMYIPNDYVLGLAKQYPEFLAAVSIHPARKDAIEELKRCAAEGAVMMKCLPNCQNIDCNLPQYQKFWETMAELGMPLLAHSGDEHTLEVLRPELGDPETLRLPLECGVNVIAAHCGSPSSWRDTNYFPIFAKLLGEYPNLYGDLSALNLPIKGQIISECLKPGIVEKMVHGSDYPIPVYGTFNWLRGYLSFGDLLKWGRQANVIERDYQYKRAMGFPEEVFTRANHLFCC